MDEIVRQAMAKWPKVPHCYGWLALDARGNWRMRDERAQALAQAGERIRNAGLTAFIHRNYTHDEDGRWYFQNGPQRVYVELEIAPFVCRTDPAAGMLLHTGAPLARPTEIILTTQGDLVFGLNAGCAVLDDRDLEQGLARLSLVGAPFDETALAHWMAGEECEGLVYDWQGQAMPVLRLAREALAARYGFNPHPAAAQASA
jgi:hypothetical protein